MASDMPSVSTLTLGPTLPFVMCCKETGVLTVPCSSQTSLPTSVDLPGYGLITVRQEVSRLLKTEDWS